MRFIIREIMGWALVLLGLGFFLLAFMFCAGRRPLIFEGAIMAVIGVFVFRGGIHLLKVAVAARICSEANDRLYPKQGEREAPSFRS